MNDTAFIHRRSGIPAIQKFGCFSRGIMPEMATTQAEAIRVCSGITGLGAIGSYAGAFWKASSFGFVDTDYLNQSVSPIERFQNWTEYQSLQRQWLPVFQQPDSNRLCGGNARTISLAATADEYIILYSTSLSLEFSSKVRELLQLKRGWDGDEAKTIRTDVLLNAVELLVELKRSRSEFILPFMAPTYEGAVLLDWTSQNRTLEVQFEEDGGWSAVGTVIHRNGDKEYFETSVPIAGEKLSEYYDWFINKLLIWPTQ